MGPPPYWQIPLIIVCGLCFVLPTCNKSLLKGKMCWTTGKETDVVPVRVTIQPRLTIMSTGPWSFMSHFSCVVKPELSMFSARRNQIKSPNGKRKIQPTSVGIYEVHSLHLVFPY